MKSPKSIYSTVWHLPGMILKTLFLLYYSATFIWLFNNTFNLPATIIIDFSFYSRKPNCYKRTSSWKSGEYYKQPFLHIILVNVYPFLLIQSKFCSTLVQVLPFKASTIFQLLEWSWTSLHMNNLISYSYGFLCHPLSISNVLYSASIIFLQNVVSLTAWHSNLQDKAAIIPAYEISSLT